MNATSPILGPNGETEILGLLGHPISHSLSPQMQSRWLQLAKKNALYLPFPCQNEKDFEGLLVSLLKLPNFRGANITIPYKPCALTLPNIQQSETVRRAKAANTVYRLSDGAWALENTDVTGVKRTCEWLGFHHEHEFQIIALGAGGATGAVLEAANQLQSCKRIMVVARDSQKAMQNWQDSNQLLAPAKHFLAADLDAITKVGFTQPLPTLLVNTLPLGHQGEQNPWAENILNMLQKSKVRCSYFDMIYNDTPALKHCVSLGIQGLNGKLMLIAQGMESFRLWMGEAPPVTLAEELATL
jgi:shikimate dehydrogenase